MNVQALTCPKCGANVKATDRTCPFCGATLVVTTEAGQRVLKPQRLAEVAVGDHLLVSHPGQGQRDTAVTARTIFEELWQEVKGGPWVPTGGAFAGLWLDAGWLLLNWQDRFYLLDERAESTNFDIQRDFAPYARQFGQSDQKARVEFDYGSSRWRMDDIGKFRVNLAEGENPGAPSGAVGRFIHASGSGRALVVEDYESSGGGQDTVWKGYLLQEKDFQKPR